MPTNTLEAGRMMNPQGDRTHLGGSALILPGATGIREALAGIRLFPQVTILLHSSFATRELKLQYEPESGLLRVLGFARILDKILLRGDLPNIQQLVRALLKCNHGLVYVIEVLLIAIKWISQCNQSLSPLLDVKVPSNTARAKLVAETLGKPRLAETGILPLGHVASVSDEVEKQTSKWLGNLAPRGSFLRIPDHVDSGTNLVELVLRLRVVDVMLDETLIDMVEVELVLRVITRVLEVLDLLYEVLNDVILELGSEGVVGEEPEIEEAGP